MQGRAGVQTETGWEVAPSGHILTSASLSATSTMLPITMRESNVFQASLKYPWTERAGADVYEHVGRRSHADHVGTYPGPAATTATRGCGRAKGK